MSEKEFISCYDEFFDMVWRICFVELSGKKQAAGEILPLYGV